MFPERLIKTEIINQDSLSEAEIQSQVLLNRKYGV
jgi:hypothetical protein